VKSLFINKAGEKVVPISVRVPLELRNRALGKARHQERSLSAYIRKLISNDLEPCASQEQIVASE
jgi:predicted DNA-binding protein